MLMRYINMRLPPATFPAWCRTTCSAASAVAGSKVSIAIAAKSAGNKKNIRPVTCWPLIDNGSQMPRFYCAHPLSVGALIALPDHVAHHVQVLRLAAGDRITLFNGEGGEYTATL